MKHIKNDCGRLPWRGLSELKVWLNECRDLTVLCGSRGRIKVSKMRICSPLTQGCGVLGKKGKSARALSLSGPPNRRNKLTARCITSLHGLHCPASSTPLQPQDYELRSLIVSSLRA